MSMSYAENFELHFLPFGSVVEAEFDSHKIKLMVVDWSVHDDSCNYDYLGVSWPKGFVGGKTVKDTVVTIPFSSDAITDILFYGPTDKGFLERDAKAFEIAKKNNQQIFKMTKEGVLESLKLRTVSSHVYKRRNLDVIERAGVVADLLPIGSIALIGLPENYSEVMITSLVLGYRKQSFDYEAIPFRSGYCSVEVPIVIQNKDIKRVKSLGFINAEVQLLVNYENVKEVRGET